MEFEQLIVLACVFVEGFIGTIPTILMIALTLGLALACIWLTCLVLWQGVTWAATMTAWRTIKTSKRYVRMKIKEYFAHLKWWGLTESAVQIAVACSFAAWLLVVAAFIFHAHSQTLLIVLACTLTAFSIAGWRKKGPRCTFPRFVGSFYEPTIMFVGPTVLMKAIEAGMKAVAG